MPRRALLAGHQASPQAGAHRLGPIRDCLCFGRLDPLGHTTWVLAHLLQKPNARARSNAPTCHRHAVMMSCDVNSKTTQKPPRETNRKTFILGGSRRNDSPRLYLAQHSQRTQWHEYCLGLAEIALTHRAPHFGSKRFQLGRVALFRRTSL